MNHVDRGSDKLRLWWSFRVLGVLPLLCLIACTQAATTPAAPDTTLVADTDLPDALADVPGSASPDADAVAALNDAATEVAAPADVTADGEVADAVDVLLPTGCPADPPPTWVPKATPTTVTPPPGRQCALPGWPGPIAAKPVTFVLAPNVLALPADTSVDHCLVWQDLDGDGWEDLAFLMAPTTPTGGRKLAIARGKADGTLQLEVHPTKLMAQPFDCAVADLEHDGKPELLVTTLPALTVLELTGASIGNDVTAKYLSDSYPFGWAVTVADLDGDGAQDVYLAPNHNVAIEGKYSCANADAPYFLCCLDVASEACMQTKQGTSAVSTCCVGAPPPSPHFILHNKLAKLVDVSGQFTVNTGAGMTVTAHDVDRDGRTDLFLGNDFGPHGWLINRGDSFALVTQAAGMRPYAHIMGSVMGDFDGDQQDDLLVTDWGAATLYRATASGFVDASAAWGIWPNTQNTMNWAPFAEDWDRDGHLDYAMTVSAVVQPGNLGQIETGDKSVFLAAYHLVGQNVGGQFVTTQLPWPGAPLFKLGSMVGVTADYDHDGDLDFIFGYGAGQLGVWRNDTPLGNHWLTVRAVDDAGPVLGALVQVWAQGHVQERQIRNATGWGAHAAPVARFGLGSVAQVDAVRVWWPSGKVTEVLTPASDQQLTVQMP